MEIGKILGTIFKIVVTIIGLFLAIFIFLQLFIAIACEIHIQLREDIPEFGGDYYVSVSKKNDNNYYTVAYYRNEIYNETVNYDNLALVIGENIVVDISKEDVNNNAVIRCRLLEEGKASIVNEKEASEEELNAQTTAKLERKGIWGKNDDGSKVDANPQINEAIVNYHLITNIITFLKNNIIFKWIIRLLYAIFGFSIVFTIIKIIVTKQRVSVVFMGGTSSGKTTIIKKLRNPNLTKKELLDDAVPTVTSNIIKEEPFLLNGKKVTPAYIDNAGNSIGEMIDELLDYGEIWFSQKVVVYVFAGTEMNVGEFIDCKTFYSELGKAFATMKILNSKSVNRKMKKILFINKVDLLEDAKNVEEKLKEKYSVFEELCQEVDIVVSGSGLEGYGLGKLRDELTTI